MSFDFVLLAWYIHDCSCQTRLFSRPEGYAVNELITLFRLKFKQTKIDQDKNSRRKRAKWLVVVERACVYVCMPVPGIYVCVCAQTMCGGRVWEEDIVWVCVYIFRWFQQHCNIFFSSLSLFSCVNLLLCRLL